VKMVAGFVSNDDWHLDEHRLRAKFNFGFVAGGSLMNDQIACATPPEHRRVARIVAGIDVAATTAVRASSTAGLSVGNGRNQKNSTDGTEDGQGANRHTASASGRRNCSAKPA